MQSEHSDASREREVPHVDRSRRSFLKALGVATATGLSAALNPGESRGAGVLSPRPPLASGSGEAFWHHVRAQFTLDRKIAHLNTGTEGSMPRSVLKALSEANRQLAHNPMEALGTETLGSLQLEARTNVAEFMGADPDEIVISGNTTEGTTMVINGLNLAPGDVVLTTLHDHAAVRAPLRILRDRRGVVIKELALPSPPESKAQILALFEAAMDTYSPKALCFCHIHYTTGLRMPVAELCEMAASRGIVTLVDGAHALGMLDVNLHGLGCDFYACAGHKWLNGPPGTGVLYVRKQAQEQNLMWPTLSYAYPMTTGLANALMSHGQKNTPAMAAMNEAIQFQRGIGKEKIQERILSLNGYLKARLLDAGWRLFVPAGDSGDAADFATGLATFNPFESAYDGDKVKALIDALRLEYGLYPRYVSFFDTDEDLASTKPTYVIRVSTHIFNGVAQIDDLVAAVQESVTAINSGALSRRTVAASHSSADLDYCGDAMLLR